GDIRSIGRALNVDKVIEGSVRRSGQRWRVTAQLIDVHDGFHLWAQRYDYTDHDWLDLQDEVSREIVEAIQRLLDRRRVPKVLRSPPRACSSLRWRLHEAVASRGG